MKFGQHQRVEIEGSTGKQTPHSKLSHFVDKLPRFPHFHRTTTATCTFERWRSVKELR